MVSPEYIEEQRHEAPQAPLSVVEKVEEQEPETPQAPLPAVEKQESLVLKRRRAWLTPLERSLGIVLAPIGGFAYSWCAMLAAENWGDPSGIGWIGGILVVLLAATCVVLFSPLRSFAVVVPVLFALGALLAFFFGVPLHSHYETYSVVATYSMALPVSVITGFVLAIVGAIIGFEIMKMRR
jgi:hypothetical protein